MSSPKENSSITELEGMEFYILADKGFEIAFLKKLNKLQENSDASTKS